MLARSLNKFKNDLLNKIVSEAITASSQEKIQLTFNIATNKKNIFKNLKQLKVPESNISKFVLNPYITSLQSEINQCAINSIITLANNSNNDNSVFIATESSFFVTSDDIEDKEIFFLKPEYRQYTDTLLNYQKYLSMICSQYKIIDPNDYSEMQNIIDEGSLLTFSYSCTDASILETRNYLPNISFSNKISHFSNIIGKLTINQDDYLLLSHGGGSIYIEKLPFIVSLHNFLDHKGTVAYLDKNNSQVNINMFDNIKQYPDIAKLHDIYSSIRKFEHKDIIIYKTKSLRTDLMNNLIYNIVELYHNESFLYANSLANNKDYYESLLKELAKNSSIENQEYLGNLLKSYFPKNISNTQDASKSVQEVSEFYNKSYDTQKELSNKKNKINYLGM